MKSNRVLRLLRRINSLLPSGIGSCDSLCGLTLSQVCMLGEVLEKPRGELSVSAISRETGFSKSSVCATLKSLRQLGYVEMDMDGQDNRRKEILPTEKAEAVRADVLRYLDAFGEELCSGLADGDRETLERSLAVVAGNVGRMRRHEAGVS